MHISDGILSGSVLLAGWAGTCAGVAIGLKRTDTAKIHKRRPNIFIFGPEDLDNDDIISAVEQTPTYKRTKEVLASIGNQGVVTEISRQEPPETPQGVISFA